LCYLVLSILAASQDVNLTTPSEAVKTVIMLAMGFAAEKKHVLRKEWGVPLWIAASSPSSTVKTAIILSYLQHCSSAWVGRQTHTRTIHLPQTPQRAEHSCCSKESLTK